MHAATSQFFQAILTLNLVDVIADEVIRSLPLWFSKEISAASDLEQHLFEYIEWLGTNWDYLRVDDEQDACRRLTDIIRYTAQMLDTVNFDDTYIDEITHLGPRLAHCRLLDDIPY